MALSLIIDIVYVFLATFNSAINPSNISPNVLTSLSAFDNAALVTVSMISLNHCGASSYRFGMYNSSPTMLYSRLFTDTSNSLVPSAIVVLLLEYSTSIALLLIVVWGTSTSIDITYPSTYTEAIFATKLPLLAVVQSIAIL